MDRIDGEVRCSSALGGEPERRTAREALTAAAELVFGFDREARLTMITSASDIQVDGRSHTWELFYDFPSRRAQAVARVGSSDDDFVDTLGIVVTGFPRFRPQGITEKSLDADFARELANNGVLPTPFRDSPDACIALQAAGVDFFDLRDTSNLVARRIDGQPLWEIFHRPRDANEELAFRIPFAG